MQYLIEAPDQCPKSIPSRRGIGMHRHPNKDDVDLYVRDGVGGLRFAQADGAVAGADGQRLAAAV